MRTRVSEQPGGIGRLEAHHDLESILISPVQSRTMANKLTAGRLYSALSQKLRPSGGLAYPWRMVTSSASSSASSWSPGWRGVRTGPCTVEHGQDAGMPWNMCWAGQQTAKRIKSEEDVRALRPARWHEIRGQTGCWAHAASLIHRRVSYRGIVPRT